MVLNEALKICAAHSGGSVATPLAAACKTAARDSALGFEDLSRLDFVPSDGSIASRRLGDAPQARR
jgi:hypothetical protein